MIKFYIDFFQKLNDSGFPYIYKNILTNYQFYKSFSILMYINNNWAGFARLHYINKNTYEFGDFFLSEQFRGKKYKGKKYYQYLLDYVIKQAKLQNKNVKNITLAVEKNDLKAIFIYEKNGFKIFNNKSKYKLKIPKKKFIYMIKYLN